jgi:peroxiredoxin
VSCGWLPSKRATFVIGRGGRVPQVITSEGNMDVHAGKALTAVHAAHDLAS